MRRLDQGRYAVTAGGGRTERVEVSDPLTYLAQPGRGAAPGRRGSRR